MDRSHQGNLCLIDYGVHSFTHCLSERVRRDGFGIRYIANGSLESPNLGSLEKWKLRDPSLIRVIKSSRPYGKLSLSERTRGELEWAGSCIRALRDEKPVAVIGSCLPLLVVTRIRRWCRAHSVPFVYWLQDLQGPAMTELLGQRFGTAGRLIGRLAGSMEQRALAGSDFIITISPNHAKYLPARILKETRYGLLENWATVEEWPLLRKQNEWAVRNGLHESVNVVYSGTLGFKHDLNAFIELAKSLSTSGNFRVVVVSSGRAAEELNARAGHEGLTNFTVLPFQSYDDMPQVLASATVLIAPLEPRAGSFCVPSKVLTYLCAGRPIVISLEPDNSAAQMIALVGAGQVVKPGDSSGFAAAVRGYLEEPGLAACAGNAARAYAEQTFSVGQVLARFRNILSSAKVELPAIGNRAEHLTLTAGSVSHA